MKKDLWIRLRDYHFDNLVPPALTDRVVAMFGRVDAPTQAFASKLSRKHGWTTRFARHAIHEYKKFVFLGVSNPTRVTPSRVIDVVWHEHLLFSRPYREFCDTVLGQHFDHHPELVAAYDLTNVFNLQYEATLDAYEREFNCTPPADVWGTTKFDRSATKTQPHLARDTSPTPSQTGDTDVPLYVLVSGDSSLGVEAGAGSVFDFGEGGGFAGGGGGSSWGEGSSPSDASDTSGSSDAGGSSDGGGGGSSCSSSCSGGCSS